jgi:adenylylsulfate kinase
MITWLTGNSGAGKTTRAEQMRTHEVVLDGDVLRTIWPGLGFSKDDRLEQNWRAARLAKMLSDQGFDVLVATICPYRDQRRAIAQLIGCTFIYLAGGKEGPEYPYEMDDSQG